MRGMTMLTGVCAAALLAVPANAQDVAPTSADVPPQQAAVAEPRANQGIEDIVVTAQRREETLQTSGIAVSAISGDQVAALATTQPSDLTRLVPAVTIAQQAGSFTLFYLRGVGSFGGNSLSDSATAFNYDGVYIARSSSTYGMYYDLQRVEVLKGPQGTLYGRNATGGAINIIPNRPELGSRAMDFAVDVGNYDAVTANAAVNLPVGANAALRVAGQVSTRDGYFSDGTDDNKGQAARAQFLYEPSDTLSVRLSADYFHAGGKGPGTTLRLANGDYLPGGPRVGIDDPRARAYLASLAPPFRPFLPGTPRLDNTYWGLNAQVDLSLGSVGTLTVIPAYRRSRTDFLTHASGFTIDQRERSKQTSLEARIASPDGEGRLIDYVVGGYYLYDDTSTNGVLYATDAAGAAQRYTPRTRSLAAFGQLTVNVSDRLRLVGGARYTDERKRSLISVDNTPAGPSASDVNTSPNLRFNKVTWRGAVEFDLAERSLFYASAESGFKAGGFSLSSTETSYGPEAITAYTVGLKNSFFDRRVLFNVEGFWWDYRDQQYTHLGAFQAGPIVVPSFATENIGDATIKGVEIETQLLPARNTLIGAQVQYLDATYDSFSFRTPQLGPFVAPPNVGAVCRSVYAPPAGRTPQTPGGIFNVDCAGTGLPFSSKWTINGAIQQTIPLGADSIVLNVSGRYESARYDGTEFLVAELQKAVATGDASITYNLADRALSVTAYVKNFTNEDILSQAFPAFTTPAYVAAGLRPPRTYGIRLAGHF